MNRRAAARAASVAVVLGTGGCETTQQLSAKIGRRLGHQSAVAGTTSLGTASRDVRVARTALLTSGGQTAVALQLTNTSAQTQTDFPVLIDVLDSAGGSVYRNNTKGIEASIQQLALLPAHATAWWVDNEILASGGVPKTVRAQLGASASGAAAAVVPELTTHGVSASESFPGPHVSVTIDNRSAIPQTQLAVYAVALKGGQVVGAGRGVVAALAAGTSAALEIPMIGSVDGSTISLTVAPTRAG
jgi:hypothetical protein